MKIQDTNIYLGDNQIYKIYEGSTIVYDKTSPEIFTGLTFTAIAYSTISFNNSAPQLQYKINNGDWIDYDTASVLIYLNAGDKIKWKRKVSTVRTFTLGQFHMTGSLAASGNIMSLLDGDNYSTMTDLTGWGSGSDGIFKELFMECASLTTAPELPATTLAPYCYYDMFSGCTGLTSAPALPATTLQSNCYAGMFVNCSVLAQAPVLNATVLVDSCYDCMFRYCSSLNLVTCLATSGFNTSRCLFAWLQGVSGSGTFTKAAGVTDWTTGQNGIPSGWNVEER